MAVKLVLVVTQLIALVCPLSTPDRGGRFSPEEKVELLSTINRYRASPQYNSKSWMYPLPRAENMMELRWDYRLENIAQNFTNRCSFSYGSWSEKSPMVRQFYREMRDDLSQIYLGETIAYMHYDRAIDTSSQYLESVVSHWFNSENTKQPFIYNDCNCGVGNDCNLSWNQMITMMWAESELIGCAQTYCPNSVTDHLVVCNFYPGPYMDTCPYKAFQDYVKCPRNYYRSPKGLCTCQEGRCNYMNYTEPPLKYFPSPDYSSDDPQQTTGIKNNEITKENQIGKTNAASVAVIPWIFCAHLVFMLMSHVLVVS